MNALNLEMLQRFSGLLDSLSAHSEIRALIVAAKGKNFSAGADINELYALDRVKAAEFRATMRKIVTRILELDFPVIFALKGYSLGGGLELSESADIRVASEDAVIGQPEVAIGINAGAGGNVFLPKIVGRGMASLLSMTGRKIDSQEALRIGLIDVISKGDPLEEALRIAEKISSFPYETVKTIKRGIVSSVTDGWIKSFVIEENGFVDLSTSTEVKKRMKNFLNK